MTSLLLRLFAGDVSDGADPATRAAVGSLSGAVGIICNLLLCTGKLVAGMLTGSVSITADAMNNLSDASSAIVTLLGFRLAKRPADAEHPYGHARFEYLSGLAVAVLILFIGFELGKSSVEKILVAAPVALTVPTALVLTGSIGLKIWLSRFYKKLGRLIDSTALLATAADSRNDVIATSAVLVAAAAETVFGLHIDGIVGLGVAAFILYSGWQLARETISPLLGEGASPELRELIVDYISAQPRVLGFHDLLVHDYGPGQRIASIHVEMDMREDPLACHALIDDMERECLRSHNIRLVIHYDPVDTVDPELNALREKVETLVSCRDGRMSIHDFRLVRGSEYTDLIFDVVLPADLRGQEETIKKDLELLINAGSTVTYRTVITFDPAD